MISNHCCVKTRPFIRTDESVGFLVGFCNECGHSVVSDIHYSNPLNCQKCNGEMPEVKEFEGTERKSRKIILRDEKGVEKDYSDIYYALCEALAAAKAAGIHQGPDGHLLDWYMSGIKALDKLERTV